MLLLLTMSLLTGTVYANGDQAIAPPADGLAWGVVPTTGQSCPFVPSQEEPRPKLSQITAFGTLDRNKYDGDKQPSITFVGNVVVLSVIPLDAKNIPIEDKAVEFRGTANDETGELRFDTATRWDPTANKNKGAGVPFIGFPAGLYDIKVVANVRLSTAAKVTPKADAKVESRDAILITTLFQVW